ncbi:MAG: hypothetical protein U5N58_03165 [Actinomycetota bacterium]|nr:hypothetical protein [Actinomycetota bacterium]
MAVDYEQDVIPGAGMGSSAAEIVGGIMIADRAYRLGLDAGSRLDIAYALERRPDNVAAALGGGMVVCYRDKGRYHYHKVAVCPQLEILLFVPRSGR